MKTFLVALILAVAAVTALPYGDDPDYALVPVGAGNFKLVNIHQDPEPDNFFNAVTDTIFVLFTRSNPTSGQIIELGNPQSLVNSNFNPNHPVRVLIHGWQSDASSPSNTLPRDAYLATGDFNVIVVDWGAGAQTINYVSARNRVGAVGVVTAQFMQMINAQYPNVLPSDITIAGHSLGSHVAGFTGKNLIGNLRLGAIVALDAALPLFSIDTPAARVAVGDAAYVESIHTNAGLLGFDQPIGDSNFYPNWGSSQPGCGIDVSGACAHARSNEFFAESITTQRHFWSRQCGSYEEIVNRQCVAVGVDRKMGGEPIETLARGIYWLTTNNNSPFATGVV